MPEGGDLAAGATTGPTAARPWTVPRAEPVADLRPQMLADTPGGLDRDQTNGSVMLESKGRPLTAGDVLMLARRRDEFGRALVRA